jgi:hypothetical protein
MLGMLQQQLTKDSTKKAQLQGQTPVSDRKNNKQSKAHPWEAKTRKGGGKNK